LRPVREPVEIAALAELTGLVEHAAVEEVNAHHVVLVLSTDDCRADHLRAGAALQSARLAYRAAGMLSHPLTGLLHSTELRAGLIERLELAGYPQAVLLLPKDSQTSGRTAAVATGQPI
jgi:hypothetical protein